MRRLVVVATLGFGLVQSSRFAYASSGEPFQFSWERGMGAETCPSQEKIARMVAAKLNRDPFDDNAKRHIRGRVERQADEWIVHVDEYDGEKLIDTRDGSSAAPNCDAILATSVFLVARIIETGIGPPEAPAPPPPSPSIPPPAPDKPIVVTNPVRSVRASFVAAKKHDGSFFVGTGVGIGLLPVPAGMVSVAGGFGKGHFEASAGMVFLPETNMQGGAFLFGMTAGWLGGCIRTKPDARAVLLGCTNVFAGAAYSVVNDAGYDPVTPGARAWVAMSATPRLRVSIWGPFGGEIGADILVPFTRLQSTVDEGTLYTQPPIAWIPFVRLGVLFN